MLKKIGFTGLVCIIIALMGACSDKPEDDLDTATEITYTLIRETNAEEYTSEPEEMLNESSEVEEEDEPGHIYEDFYNMNIGSYRWGDPLPLVGMDYLKDINDSDTYYLDALLDSVNIKDRYKMLMSVGIGVWSDWGKDGLFESISAASEEFAAGKTGRMYVRVVQEGGSLDVWVQNRAGEIIWEEEDIRESSQYFAEIDSIPEGSLTLHGRMKEVDGVSGSSYVQCTVWYEQE
jgi:hypothetical protein